GTTCCPDGCTTSTPQGMLPARTAAGEIIVPVPPNQTASTTPASPAPSAFTSTASPAPNRTRTSLFRRSKPGESDVAAAKAETSADMPKANKEKPDPLKDPVPYSSPKTNAELAGATAPKADAPLIGSAARMGKTPLGAGSVVAAGDPQYLPVPI